MSILIPMLFKVAQPVLQLKNIHCLNIQILTKRKQIPKILTMSKIIMNVKLPHTVNFVLPKTKEKEKKQTE